MLKFGISEYIRNFWFNLCIVMLLLVMMITSAILVSNIDEQTGAYRLAETYLDDDSMFLSYVFSSRIEELEAYGELLAVQVIFGGVENNESSNIMAMVYPEEVMNQLKPRIDFGTYPQNVKSDENIVCALISQNPYGLKVGDTFVYEVFAKDGSLLQFQVYIAGVISEGQRLYTEARNISTDMTYEDFFPVYSYEQTQQVKLIIPETEIKKIQEEKLYSYYSNIMLNPDDDLSADERNSIWEKIKNYELEFSGVEILSPYPSALELVERNEIMYKSIVMKYLPLCVVVILLFSISIIGMVTIKTVKSIRYYGIMYVCGMQYRTALLTAGMEMCFNCVMAFMSTIVLLTLQKVFDIVGEINCNLDTAEVCVLLLVCVVMVVSSVLATRGVLKENTPIEILKNTN